MSATKNELCRIQEGLRLAGQNLLIASELDDGDLIEAILVNTLASLPSYLDAVVGN
jgi:hypothetical protein